MLPAEGQTAKVIPSSMGSSAWLNMVINLFLRVFEESTKTTIMSEKMKNHDEEEDQVHTLEVNKKKKKKELSRKRAKQRGQEQSKWRSRSKTATDG